MILEQKQSNNFSQKQQAVNSPRNRQIIELLGLQSDHGLTPSAQCLKCQRKMQQLLGDLKTKTQQLDVLHRNIQLLEQHNRNVMMQTKGVVHRFSKHIEFMKNQVVVRDQMNEQLNNQLEVEERVLKQIQKQLQNREEVFREEWEQRQKDYKDFVEQLKEEYNEIISQKQSEINSLRIKVSKSITQKANIERKRRNQQRQFQIKIFELKEEIKSYEEQITNKEKLIKYLSTSNDELRLQIIDMRTKQEVNDLTWVTDRRKSTDFKNDQIERENDKLRHMIQRLQNQVDKLVQEGERANRNYESIRKEKDRIQHELEDIKKKGNTLDRKKGSILKQRKSEQLGLCRDRQSIYEFDYHQKKPDLQILIDELDEKEY